MKLFFIVKNSLYFFHSVAFIVQFNDHHLNATIISKYRLVNWFFAVDEGMEIKEVYLLKPDQLEPFLKRWEDNLNADKRDINKPKYN